ncbi:MAG TPA: hypothetical protein VMM76_22765, partial [Pirellulaceae bacterium]|nr:hypothetical protein [Pirellulaceae bacterium]
RDTAVRRDCCLGPVQAVPFNMIMIGVFSFTVGSSVRVWFCKRPITIKVWQRDVNWFAKVYKFLPIAAAGVAALAISFISIFVVSASSSYRAGF